MVDPSGGQLIEQARREAGLSGAELARRAHTSRPTLAAYEHGAKSPTPATAQRLLAAAQDSGFDLQVFADMIGTMRRFTDEDLLLASPDADCVRAFFAAWREDILAGDAVVPQSTPSGA